MTPGWRLLHHRLRVVGKKVLRESIVDAWLACEPSELAEEYLATRSR